MISVGNEADLGIGEIGDLLVDDADTDVILLFIETIRDQKQFSAMARRAFAAGKPVIAYLLGRSDLGSSLAASHTGAIVGNTAAIEAFLRDNGVMRVDMIETLFEMAPMVVGRRPPGAARINVMTTTGGGGALIVDNLGLRGVQATAPGEAVIAKLAKQDIRIANSPLIDLTLTGTNPKVFGAVLDSLIESRDSNAIIAVVGSSSQSRPERAVVPIIDRARKSDKPVAAFLTPDATESARLLFGASVAVFRTPEACADAMRAYFDWKAPAPVTAIDRTFPAELIRIAQGRGIASASEASWILELLGIDQARTVSLSIEADSAEIEAMVFGLKFPVAVKIDSPDIPHKTEAGGVVLNVLDIKTLASALSSIRETVHKHRPDAKLDGFIVQEMHSGVAEVLLGYRVDSHVGPTIAVGVGGVLAEIYRDVVVAVAPVSIDAARELIGKVRGFAPIRGYRNLPTGDIEALARVIAAWSSLAAIPQSRIVEAELNPLLVDVVGKGAAAVDALIVRAD
jgi:acyl-CoA synthetase (NDP forming)